MGYSARYHATSLIAVFLALAVGILVGAEFGGGALTTTRKNLESSLVGNLQDARSHAEDLAGELGRSNEFGEKVYPDLTGEQLQGKRLAIVALGGTLAEFVRAQLFSRASGTFGGLDGVIVVRSQPQNMGPVQRSTASQFETALLAGMTATRMPAVGVESTSTEPSSISFFQSNGLSTVDDVNDTAGKVSLIFGLRGAEGSFGVKSSADRLLPDLLEPGS
jgi:hypothetical protein